MASPTDLLDRVTDSTTGRPVISALASGKAIAAGSISITDATNWTTNDKIHFVIYKTTTVGSATVKDPSTQTDWTGTLIGTTISNLVLTGGTDQAYVAGAIVELTPTARWAKDLDANIAGHANQDGSLKTAAVQTALGLGASTLNGYNALAFAPNSVVCNGNRSYTLTFNTNDLTGTLSPGMRIRTTRNTTAPVACTSLNGTTQFWSRASGSLGATFAFTNNFVISAWVKLSVYQDGCIASRYNGTSGFEMSVNSATGQLYIQGRNGGAANVCITQSYQSLPLNKWVHVAAQLDMTSTTNSPTVNYVMFDGIDVPATVTRAGTNPTSLLQAGNLEIGSRSGGLIPFAGKIAQVAIYSAKVTQANILATISQGLIGTETSLISAYSFATNGNDLNTTNANNLTANNGAAAGSTDSPFGGQAGGTISSTLDYGIVHSVAFSTNTTVVVQVPEGCTIPTSGTVSAVAYSSNRAPYGFPAQKGKWSVKTLIRSQEAINIGSTGGWVAPSINCLNIPIGEWKYGFEGAYYQNSSVTGGRDSVLAFASGTPPVQVAPSPNMRPYSGASSTVAMISGRADEDGSFAVATTFRLFMYLNTASGAEQWNINGTQTECVFFAENAYL